MAWFQSKIWIKFIFLFSTLAVLAVSEHLSEEKSRCTDESCDSDEVLKFQDGTDEEERESGVHLAYSCASPNYVPEEGTPVIFLHGCADSRQTWNGIYQNIPILTHRKACVYDARNHGDSGWNDTFNIDVLAEDLGHLIDKLKIERAVLVGHSMGGMTAMKFALNNPSKVDGLILEDISPMGLPKSAMNMVGGAFAVLHKSVSMVPKDADEDTAKKTVADFVQKLTHHSIPEVFAENFQLRQKDGIWQWKANFDVIMKSLKDPNTLAVRPQGQYAGKALFIYGKLSMFRVENDKKDIRKYFPNAEFFGVEGAEHLIHSVRPEFQTQLIKFLE